jgi:hypothetical protein
MINLIKEQLKELQKFLQQEDKWIQEQITQSRHQETQCIYLNQLRLLVDHFLKKI